MKAATSPRPTRHSWAWITMDDPIDRCQREGCKARRKEGGRRYLYSVIGQGRMARTWSRQVPPCTGGLVK